MFLKTITLKCICLFFLFIHGQSIQAANDFRYYEKSLQSTSSAIFQPKFKSKRLPKRGYYDEFSLGVYAFHYTFRHGYALHYSQSNKKPMYGISYSPNYFISYGRNRGHTLALHIGYKLIEHRKYSLLFHIGQTFTRGHRYFLKSVREKNEHIIQNMGVNNEIIYKNYWMKFVSFEYNRFLTNNLFTSMKAMAFRRYHYKIQGNKISLMPSLGIGVRY
jgi:hypothetical protein